MNDTSYSRNPKQQSGQIRKESTLSKKSVNKDRKQLTYDSKKELTNADKHLQSFNQAASTQNTQARPVSPETQNAQDFFDSIQRKGYGDKRAVIDLIVENRKKNKEFNEQYVEMQAQVAKTVHDTKEELKLRALINEERQREDAKNSKNSDYKATLKNQKLHGPQNVSALPPLKKRFRPMKPIEGISYLANTGLYEDIITKRKNAGNMTRRNITEYKISQNILQHNSPIAAQNYDSLNLGP